MMRIAFALFAAALIAPAPARYRPPEVALRVAKGAELEAEIRRHRGKVVLVNYWAVYNFFDHRRFPGLVKFERRYAEDALVVISVSLDSIDGKAEPRAGTLASIAEFLKKQDATFTNLVLEDADEWCSIAKIPSTPWIQVYDRRGTRMDFGPGELSQDAKRRTRRRSSR
jgi:hypothetical protein